MMNLYFIAVVSVVNHDVDALKVQISQQSASCANGGTCGPKAAAAKQKMNKSSSVATHAHAKHGAKHHAKHGAKHMAKHMMYYRMFRHKALSIYNSVSASVASLLGQAESKAPPRKQAPRPQSSVLAPVQDAAKTAGDAAGETASDIQNNAQWAETKVEEEAGYQPAGTAQAEWQAAEQWDKTQEQKWDNSQQQNWDSQGQWDDGYYYPQEEENSMSTGLVVLIVCAMGCCLCCSVFLICYGVERCLCHNRYVATHGGASSSGAGSTSS